MLNAYVDSQWKKPQTWRLPFSGINRMDSNQNSILFSYRSYQGYQLASISYAALLKCATNLTDSAFCYSEQLSYELSLTKVGEEFVGCCVQEHVLKIQKICLGTNKNTLTEIYIEGLEAHRFNYICDVCTIYDKIFILGKLEEASCGAILAIDLASLHIDKIELFHDLYVKVKAISSLLGRLHILLSQSGLKNSFILTLDYTK